MYIWQISGLLLVLFVSFFACFADHVNARNTKLYDPWIRGTCVNVPRGMASYLFTRSPAINTCRSGLTGSPNAEQQDDAFQANGATIYSIHEAIQSRDATCRDIISSHLARIEALNGRINAIITLNPDALQTADELDRDFRANGIHGTLFCVPVMVKDNIDAVGMPTTSGCLALRDLWPTVDSPVVGRLRSEKAIILGKTNLHEMALEGLTVSSLGGQTYNPYDLGRTPGGSSGGSGAALAASFCVIALGTDTMNSLRNPASANNIVSLRPTNGLLSVAGMLPASFSQDAVGPMARTVDDLAVAFKAMLLKSADRDGHTASDDMPKLDFSYEPIETAPPGALGGLRFGIIDAFLAVEESNEAREVRYATTSFQSALEDEGAEIVHIKSPYLNPTSISELDVQVFERREAVTKYLQDPNHVGKFPRDLGEVYATGDFLVIPAQYDHVRAALNSSTSDESYHDKRRGAKRLQSRLQALFDEHNVDFMIYPEQINYVKRVGSRSQTGRHGHLAAMTGYPVLTVGAGFSEPSGEAPRGVPIGMEILARPLGEVELFRVASLIEAITDHALAPELCDHDIPWKNYSQVSSCIPNSGNIHRFYPVGVY